MFTTKQSDVFYNDQTKEMFVCKVSSISGKRCAGPDTVFGALPIVYKINKNTNYQSIIYPKNFDTFAADNKSDLFDLLPSNYYGENTNFSSITKPLINYNKTSDRYSVTCIGRYAATSDGFGVLSYIFQYIDTNFYLLDARSYIPKAKAENNIFTFKNGYLNSDFLIGGNPLRWNQEVDTSHAERVTDYVIAPTHVDYNESLGFNLMGYCRKGVGGGSSESTCLTATRQHTFQWSGGYITYNPKYAAFDPNYDIRVDFTAKSFQVPLMTAYRSIQSDKDDPQPSRWVDTSTALSGLSGAGEGFCAFFYRNPLAGVVEPQGIGSTLGYAKASSVVSEIEGELKAVDGLVINNGGGYGDPANSFLGVGFDIKGDFCTTLEGKEGWLSAGGGPGRWSHGKHSGAFTNTTAPCSVGIRGNRNSFTRVLTCISISTVPASAVSMHQQSANSTGSDVDFQDYRIDLTHKGTRVTVYNKLTSTTDYNTILQFDLNSVKDEKGVFYRPWGGFYNRQFNTVAQGSQFPGVHAGPPPVPTAALWPGQFPGVHAGPPAIPTAALWSPQSTDEGIIIETTPSIDISPTVIPAPYGAPTTINIEPETIIIDNPSDIELYPGGRTPSQGLIAPINVGLSFTTSEYTSHFELLSFKVTGVKMGDPTKSIEKIDNITTVEYLEESSANLRRDLVNIPTAEPVDVTMLIKQQSLIDRITLCGELPEFVDSEVEAKWTGVTNRRSDIPGPPGEAPTIVTPTPSEACAGWFEPIKRFENDSGFKVSGSPFDQHIFGWSRISDTQLNSNTYNQAINDMVRETTIKGRNYIIHWETPEGGEEILTQEKSIGYVTDPTITGYTQQPIDVNKVSYINPRGFAFVHYKSDDANGPSESDRPPSGQDWVKMAVWLTDEEAKAAGECGKKKEKVDDPVDEDPIIQLSQNCWRLYATAGGDGRSSWNIFINGFEFGETKHFILVDGTMWYEGLKRYLPSPSDDYTREMIFMDDIPRGWEPDAVLVKEHPDIDPADHNNTGTAINFSFASSRMRNRGFMADVYPQEALDRISTALKNIILLNKSELDLTTPNFWELKLGWPGHTPYRPIKEKLINVNRTDWLSVEQYQKEIVHRTITGVGGSPGYTGTGKTTPFVGAGARGERCDGLTSTSTGPGPNWHGAKYYAVSQRPCLQMLLDVGWGNCTTGGGRFPGMSSGIEDPPGNKPGNGNGNGNGNGGGPGDGGEEDSDRL